MKKMSVFFACFAIIFSFASCNNNVSFRETENKTVVSNDGAEYTFVGNEGIVWCFGEWDFIGHVKGEKKTFVHLDGKIKTGMYSVNDSQDVLGRYLPDNEFSSIYVKSELLNTEIALENCIKFVFVKDLYYDKYETTVSKKCITECEEFLNEIKCSPKAKDAGLDELVKQPDGMLKNCYVYGYICGIIQEDINIVIPMQVLSFDDKAYSISVNGVHHVLPEEWLDKLITE